MTPAPLPPTLSTVEYLSVDATNYERSFRAMEILADAVNKIKANAFLQNRDLETFSDIFNELKIIEQDVSEKAGSIIKFVD